MPRISGTSLRGKTTLVTGGAGSLGQSIVSEILKYNPQSIRVFDNSEYFQFEMQGKADSRLRFLIGDVRDRDRLHRAMNGVDIVIHCAALKQVPLCEFNPIEAVKTNVNGAINVIDAVLDNKVEKVIAISSDKAVHPINLYGATKLVMEKLFTQANVYGGMFSCIRFGNFQGSRGSLIPMIEKQLNERQEITITDKEMARFWITLDKASEFIIKCLDIMTGGEIFIPKMPESQVIDILQTIAPDAKYKIIGRRPGEKLHEMLFNEDEKPQDCGEYYLIKGAL